MHSSLLRVAIALSVVSVFSAGLTGIQRPPRGLGAPGMAITGRVLDPSGKPVADVFVTALHTGAVPDRPFSFVSARLGAVTNDSGEFRLDGLYAGEFYIVALPHNPPIDAARRPTRAGFGNTFHPGVRSFAEAKPVVVRPGIPGKADLTLLPSALFTTSGVVIGSNDQPVSGGALLIPHGDGFFGLDSRAVRILPNGRFGIAGLQPGTYFLVYRESQWPPPRGTTPQVSQATVVITTADVPNVRVGPLRLVRATGRVVVDPADRGSLDPATITVGTYPSPIDGNPGPSQYGTVEQNLTFEFGAWPMPSRIRVMIDSPGWKVKSIRQEGVDITDATIDVVQGREITGLEVELVRDRTSGRGEYPPAGLSR